MSVEIRILGDFRRKGGQAIGLHLQAKQRSGGRHEGILANTLQFSFSSAPDAPGGYAPQGGLGTLFCTSRAASFRRWSGTVNLRL